MTESEYDKLSYPQTLDTITNRTIVPDSPDNSENASDLSAAFLPYASQMKEYSLPADFLDHKTSKKVKPSAGNCRKHCRHPLFCCSLLT